jgi:hypothetical protein
MSCSLTNLLANVSVNAMLIILRVACGAKLGYSLKIPVTNYENVCSD